MVDHFYERYKEEREKRGLEPKYTEEDLEGMEDYIERYEQFMASQEEYRLNDEISLLNRKLVKCFNTLEVYKQIIEDLEVKNKKLSLENQKLRKL